MSVALDLESLELESLLVAQPVPAGRPSLRLVPCTPIGDQDAHTPRALARPKRTAAVSVLHPPSTGATAPLRLTRRGVAVLAVLTAVAGALLVWAAALSAPHSAATSARPVPAAVTVHAGDTVWAIATRIAPDRDPRAEVADLRRLNHLVDPDLVPGQVLRVH